MLLPYGRFHCSCSSALMKPASLRLFQTWMPSPLSNDPITRMGIVESASGFSASLRSPISFWVSERGVKYAWMSATRFCAAATSLLTDANSLRASRAMLSASDAAVFALSDCSTAFPDAVIALPDLVSAEFVESSVALLFCQLLQFALQAIQSRLLIERWFRLETKDQRLSQQSVPTEKLFPRNVFARRSMQQANVYIRLCIRPNILIRPAPRKRTLQVPKMTPFSLVAQRRTASESF
jgi:hypothetical protein